MLIRSHRLHYSKVISVNTTAVGLVKPSWCSFFHKFLSGSQPTSLIPPFLSTTTVNTASGSSMETRRSARLGAIYESAKITEPVPAPAPTKFRKRKAVEEDDNEQDTTPSTPRRPRAAPKPDLDQAPPATPTPNAVSLIAEPVNTISKPKPAAVNRLADPNRTNALLLSPQTSRLISSTTGASVQPPTSPSAIPLEGIKTTPSTTTTTNLLEEACAHLIKVDPRMKPLIEKHHCHIFSPEGLSEKIDPFESLASGIISQQVSGAAAKAIKNRFISLFYPGNDNTTTTHEKKKFPTPADVIGKSIETLRTAGLSQRKAEYLLGLAQKFVSGELTAQMLADAPYEEVLEKLIAVRGLGRWSVEMFACFGLKRMDVFSTGDLGVQRGMAAFVGRDVGKLKAKGGGNKWKYMSEREMEEIAEGFRPYRSLFMWYMWRVEETDISTME
ncbi:3-methyladenine DNA glycosylase [Podospora pseudopauciseta]|uniref:3-methyladenine DNA glycosylase n=2 Tax=Podospora TaxID=5144 RepID=A0ABR0HR60_9PEZI|nr:3-methyladenine DNA glycosylase [Podospora pseudopauciseta]KAK4680423.1 3-methyladenine DNA glycosylase [Podospora pseudoanserina]